MKYFFSKQTSSWDCSLACLYMLINFYHQPSFSYFQFLQKHKYFQDLNLNQMQKLANQYGVFLTSYLVKWQDFIQETIEKPLICQVKDNNQFHFLIIYEKNEEGYLIADPNHDDLTMMTASDLRQLYTGIVLTSEKTVWKSSSFSTQPRKSFFTFQLAGKIAITFLIGMITTVFLLLNQFFLKLIIDEILFRKIAEIVYVLLLAFALFFLQKLFLTLLFSFLSKQIELSFKRKWNLKFLAHLQGLSYLDYQKYQLPLILKKYHHFNEILHFYFPLNFQQFHSFCLLIFSFFLLLVVDVSLLLPLFFIILLTIVVYALLIPWYQSQNQKTLAYERKWQEKFLIFLKNQPSYQARNLIAKESNHLLPLFQKQFSLYQRQHYFLLTENAIKEIFSFLVTTVTLFLLFRSTNLITNQPGTFFFLFALLNNIVARSQNFFYHFLYWQRIKLLKKEVDAFLVDSQDETHFFPLTEAIKVIKLVNFNYSYDGHHFLWKNPFNTKLTQKTIFLGASGSGKTTFFQILTKNFSDYQGEIFINQQKLRELKFSSYKEAVYSLNAYTPLLVSDVFSYITSFQYHQKILTSWKKYQIDFFLTWINLTASSKLLPSGLSNGQRQILNFLTLFFRKESLFLLDECLNSISATWRKQLLLHLFACKPKKTIFYANHHPELASYFETKIIFSTQDET